MERRSPWEEPRIGLPDDRLEDPTVRRRFRGGVVASRRLEAAAGKPWSTR